MTREWTAENVLGLVTGFQSACVLAAAAELDLFSVMAEEPATVEAVSGCLRTDVRATTILLDALTAMDLLAKDAGRYVAAPGVNEALTKAGESNVLAMVQHLANCLRSWAQLAKVTQTGEPGERAPSIRGVEGDRESFIEAMNDLCRSAAPQLVKTIGPPRFEHLLDVGGGPATWTIAFLHAMPGARAPVYDLPEVIPIARRHVEAEALNDRVTFAGGNFTTDATLPSGADLAWVSAIVHMNSSEENRRLFAKVYAALTDGGQILIRDVVMDESRTSPASGALFAVNMLVNTRAGGTYTFDELKEDLLAAGFTDPVLLHKGEFMDSVVQARKV